MTSSSPAAAGNRYQSFGWPTSASEPAALSRPPDTTCPANCGKRSAPSSRACLISATVAPGLRSASSAATPDTCGAAIEVPLNELYVLSGVVLRTSTPGAARSTDVDP